MVSTPVLFDTNILIDYLRGIPQARAECDRHSDRAVSIISWMEVMAGSTDANEADAHLFLLNFYTLPGRNKLPDAIIQATAKGPPGSSSRATRAVSQWGHQGCGFLTLSRRD